MSKNLLNIKASAMSLSLALSLGAAIPVWAQNDNTNTNTTTATNTQQTQQTQGRSVSSGQKVKLRGFVLDRQADNLTIRDVAGGGNVQVKLTGNTSIKSKKFFGSGKTYVADLLTRGLYLEAQGRGDNTGAVVAEKIRFGEDDLRNAQALEARVNPVEGRVGNAEERITATEQNAQRLSGQLDELVAISNAARGGAKAAQDTADAAVAGVNATNQRITELDDYGVQSNATVTFRLGSASLLPEAKQQLDTVAQGAANIKGYVMEVTGYADATGSTARNRALSQRRAEAVIQYLVENHGIPLRRILPSYGFGELNAAADNTTREGRAQNRRVEVKLLVSKGLSNSVEVRSGSASGDTTSQPQDTTNPSSNQNMNNTNNTNNTNNSDTMNNMNNNMNNTNTTSPRTNQNNNQNTVPNTQTTPQTTPQE